MCHIVDGNCLGGLSTHLIDTVGERYWKSGTLLYKNDDKKLFFDYTNKSSEKGPCTSLILILNNFSKNIDRSFNFF